MNNTNTLIILHTLVEALDKTTWSSWQTTAHFEWELQQAREYLDIYHEDYINYYE